jgi:hypothetical protein
MRCRTTRASAGAKQRPSAGSSWERPFPDPTQRLPQHRRVAAERREEKRRYRLWRAIRAREAAAGGDAQHC